MHAVLALVLSLSKDEPFCSWFDKLTTSEMFKNFRPALQAGSSKLEAGI
jgi:hypothetical protein